MSEYKYLDKDGLIYYHSKIKTLLNGKVSVVNGKGLSTEDFTTELKTKLNGIAEGAEVNQNAFGKIVVGQTSIEADSKVDTLTITAGNNITLTPNATSDSLTIAATDTTYSDATTTTHGLMSTADKTKLNGIAEGAEVNQNAFGKIVVGQTSIEADSKIDILTITAGNNITLTPDATNDSLTIAATDTTYSDATTTTHGLMSTADKTKLNGIAEGANKTIVDSALNSTSTNPVQNKVINSALGNKAPLASPALTGTPTAPTASAGTNTTQVATTAFVKTAVDNAISSITGIEFQIVTSLPSTGKTGVIYLISNSGTAPNIYDEYIWIASTSKFEKIGTTDVDLSGYVQDTDMVSITNAEIDTIVAA